VPSKKVTQTDGIEGPENRQVERPSQAEISQVPHGPGPVAGEGVSRSPLVRHQLWNPGRSECTLDQEIKVVVCSPRAMAWLTRKSPTARI